MRAERAVAYPPAIRAFPGWDGGHSGYLDPLQTTGD